jgi:hypothetical protein
MRASATPSPRFGEQTLARPVSRPDNPGLIAFWPGVDERRMPAACAELVHRGYPVQRVTITGRQRGKSRTGWALGDSELEPS